MTLIINNQEVVTEVTTVAALAHELDLPVHGVAIAVNNCVIRHEQWENNPIKDGDRITIIKAAYGG